MVRMWMGTLLLAGVTMMSTAEGAERGRLRLDRLHGAEFRFGGALGERVRANVERWLIVAPGKNPGLLDMFARRDSGKKPNLVPWAGEFVGKYLISGVQALRMSDDPRLRATLKSVVERLAALQAEDGYLGPWPQQERLLGHWDLWGHYHVMLGLALYHERTGDEQAMRACRRAADLVCTTYLDTKRRVFDAGSHEMNMSVIHGLARLHRETGVPRYLRMAEEVLEDFERAGDYFRLGLKGVEFHRTPRPRWESLHALQGMVELYRITGDERFRRAFLHHWASIRRWDLRNSGGFSSGERATGNPYANAAIETCCVIAWEAVMLDALRLTGDATIADDIELATLNAVAGAQHPSGAWCTYDTPMNGRRVPSHVSIRFQARPDAPLLNCCSVNGPRGLGMLSEWAAMRKVGDGFASLPPRGRAGVGAPGSPSAPELVLNHYGPMQVDTKLADGTPVTVRVEGSYPVVGEATVSLGLSAPRKLALHLRIPAWSARTVVVVNDQVVPNARPGSYLRLSRTWRRDDRVTLKFDFSLRYAAGDLDQFGRASVYRGPLLLAWDPRFDAAKENAIPPLDMAKLGEAKRIAMDDRIARAAGKFPPWLLVDVPAAGGRTVRLCDFASAGGGGAATQWPLRGGGQYRSWLAATGLRPPAPVPWKPADGARLPKGGIRFTWRSPAGAARERRHSVAIAESPSFDRPVLASDASASSSLVLTKEQAAKLKPNTVYYWRVTARNPRGQAASVPPPKSFAIDPSLPPGPDLYATAYGERPKDKAVTLAPLAGDVKPAYGKLLEARGWKPAPGPGGKPKGSIELDGTSGLVRYELAAFPETNFTVAIWVSVTRLPSTNYGQVFSAWCRGMDDPLRLVVHKGKLHARVEAGKLFGTDGVPVELSKWTHVAGVKRGKTLKLYVNGKPYASAPVPERVLSMARDFALGGNPHFGGPEFLAARVADLRFYARALSAKEIHEISREGASK